MWLCHNARMNNIEQLIGKLDSFDQEQRLHALRQIVDSTELPAIDSGQINLHLHTFFSYNASGWSPSHVAYECRRQGLYAAAICDFDVLDGLEEFFAAGQIAGLRTAAHLETRAYFSEYANVDISSPGEPGVTYIMGGAFPRLPHPQTTAGEELQALKKRARQRNVELVNRINDAIPEIAIDYARDVSPLTPADGATERHIITAYRNRIETLYPDASARTAYLAKLLNADDQKAAALLENIPALEEALRSRLAKRGGPGYQQPSPETFPDVDRFVAWVRDCDAIPLVTWLDGTSDGENDPEALLDCLAAKGCAGLNIIPDRNWNIKAPEQAAIKQAHLKAMVNAAARRAMPINIGTEMNKGGLPFYDDINGPVLKEWRGLFLEGARVMIGHTMLARYAGFGYLSDAALNEHPAPEARNRFFAAIGAIPPLEESTVAMLEEIGADKALAWFHDQTKGTP